MKEYILKNIWEILNVIILLIIYAVNKGDTKIILNIQ